MKEQTKTHFSPANESTERKQPVGVVQRLRVGRLAAYCAGIEVAAAAASFIAGDPLVAEMGGYLDAIMVGGALFGAHQHHVNGSPRSIIPMGSVIRDRSEV